MYIRHVFPAGVRYAGLAVYIQRFHNCDVLCWRSAESAKSNAHALAVSFRANVDVPDPLEYCADGRHVVLHVL